MSTMARQVLLIDIMSTIVYDPFADEIPAYFGMDLETLVAQKDPTAWVEFERAEIDEATFFARFFDDERGIDGEGLKEAVREAYAFMPGMEALLEELDAAGYEMHAMSNYPSWYRMIEEKLALSRFLEWSFVSWDTGLRKPDPAAYEHALEVLDVEADACLFVDNREDNCEAARAVGIEAIRFEGADDLAERLL